MSHTPALPGKQRLHLRRMETASFVIVRDIPGAAEAESNLQLFAESLRLGLVSPENARKGGGGGGVEFAELSSFQLDS